MDDRPGRRSHDIKVNRIVRLYSVHHTTGPCERESEQKERTKIVRHVEKHKFT